MAMCAQCGQWTEPPILAAAADAALSSVCPHCGHREPFTQYPLWWIAGSSGAGKSTLAPLLRPRLRDCIVFEGEAIDCWRFAGEPREYSSLYNQWLKVAREIALNQRPVVVLATALPEQLDACTFRSRFSVIHYLGLVCPEAVQRRRLQARPAWRNRAPDFIAQSCGFTRRLAVLSTTRTTPVTLHDTSASGPEQSAAWIATWVRAALPGA